MEPNFLSTTSPVRKTRPYAVEYFMFLYLFIRLLFLMPLPISSRIGTLNTLKYIPCPNCPVSSQPAVRKNKQITVLSIHLLMLNRVSNLLVSSYSRSPKNKVLKNQLAPNNCLPPPNKKALMISKTKFFNVKGAHTSALTICRLSKASAIRLTTKTETKLGNHRDLIFFLTQFRILISFSL